MLVAQLGQNLIEHAYSGDADPAEFAVSAQGVIDSVLEGRIDVTAQKPSEIIRGYVKYLEDLEKRGGYGMVVRPVEIVTGLENIGKLFGVGRNTVRIWQKDKGAPK
ncbi:hypothetical protein SAMN06295933_0548 [Desulfovibrio gilichinskyi]|uniref:Uncharacterized protein n=2 Tax=Desulfovibrio gilichinskyi TaxID=1519643 RepID=A0A1X7C9I7_9BACT|nr:hypothetical protein SAMN06295933_0548 [Desulfovibrio gilichinskyi]